MRPFLRAAALALACGAPGPDPGPSSGDDGEPDDAYDPPVFVDPASGALMLDHSRLLDSGLGVTSIVPGRTQLQVDGVSVGTLVHPSPIGSLEHDTLRLRFDGGMVTGQHTLQLVTPGTVAVQGSSIVEVQIVSGPIPVLSMELAADPLTTGARVLASGVGEQGLLLVLDTGDPSAPVLRIARAVDAAWQVDDVRSLDLPGHRDGGQSPRAGFAAVVVPGTDPPRIRVAWRVGDPGTRIDVREVVWRESALEAGDPMQAVSIADLGPAEWSAIDAPGFAGGHLLAMATALADSESPRPGDRVLMGAAWPADQGAPGPAVRLTFGPVADLDALGPVVDLTDERGARATLRTDRARPVVIDWAPDRNLPAELGFGLDVRTPRIEGELAGMATVAGAFGSRTVAATGTDGSVEVVVIDAGAKRSGRRADPPDDDLPAAAPSGGPAALLARGSAVFLIPYGAVAPVHALIVDGNDARVTALAGLECDQVAAPASAFANTSDSSSIACLRGGAVRIGALFFGGDG